MGKKINIKDVARFAGVSVATVSRALNFPDVVNEKTRKKVLNIIRKRSYTLNLTARSLSRGRANTVGVVLPGASASAENDYQMKIISGVLIALEKRNVNVLIHVMDSDYEKTLKAYYSGLVEGFILIAPPVDSPALDMIEKRRIPAVLVAARHGGIRNVVTETGKAFGELFSELKRRKYRRIAFISGPESSFDAKNRLRQYKKLMCDNSFNLDERFIAAGDFSFISGYRAGLELLGGAKKPDMIIAANDLTASGVYRAVSGKGLSIPADVGVAGFNNTEMGLHLMPALTTIAQDPKRMGMEAAEILNGKNDRTKSFSIEAELILRDSVNRDGSD